MARRSCNLAHAQQHPAALHLSHDVLVLTRRTPLFPTPILTPYTQPPRRRGPTLEDVLDEGEYELQPLPSDEAWFGEPDPSIYALGTNDLSKEQLAEEVAKGNVCTLRQLKQHLLTASESELEVSE